MGPKNARPQGVIAIDGPAGAGKSTVARALARRLGIRYLDTGALYRAIGLWLHRQGLAPEESAALRKALEEPVVELEGDRVLLGGQDVTDSLHTPEVGALASSFGALPSVREALMDLQRCQALHGPLVADGRDMGTVVFPLAPVKVFLTASPGLRAKRRYDELVALGRPADLEQIAAAMEERDERDRQRAVAPLKAADDAVTVDTDNLSVDQVVERIAAMVEGEDVA